MEEIMILIGLNGRRITQGWQELIPILRLIDERISQYSKWELIQRNMLHEHKLKLEIVNGIFHCELLDDFSVDYHNAELKYNKLDTWEDMVWKSKQVIV